MPARILHTSDWHLGSRVGSEPRDDDHDAVLAEIAELAADFGPDLIVHTGDLFDSARPSPTDLRRALRALRRLADIGPVVVLAGNHDAPTVFELLAEAQGASLPGPGEWDPYAVCAERLRFLPRPTAANRGAVATYRAADGTIIRLGALPFVHANRVVDGFADLRALGAAYADGIKRITEALTEAVLDGFDRATMVAVWASHLHVSGASLTSERRIHTADGYATDPADLSGDYSYLAYGHIHLPQAVPGGRGRYAGSVLEVDFGEEAETKTVVQVTAEPGIPAEIRPVRLTAGRRLRRFTGTLAELAAQRADLADSICTVTVTDDGADEHSEVQLSDYSSVVEAVRAVLPDACVVRIYDGRRGRVHLADDESDGENGEADAPATVVERYRRFLADQDRLFVPKDPSRPHAVASAERVVELFTALSDAVEMDAEADLAKLGELDRLLRATGVEASSGDDGEPG